MAMDSEALYSGFRRIGLRGLNGNAPSDSEVVQRGVLAYKQQIFHFMDGDVLNLSAGDLAAPLVSLGGFSSSTDARTALIDACGSSFHYSILGIPRELSISDYDGVQGFLSVHRSFRH